MANPEHLEILRQGVEVWNSWRSENYEITPDLTDALASGMFLSDANLVGVDFSGADLRGTDLNWARLSESWFVGANMEDASLLHAYLAESILVGANLQQTHLAKANLSSADLRDASLRHAYCVSTIFTGTGLVGCDFNEAEIGWSSFDRTDLSCARGLESVHHVGPSSIGTDTLYRSSGNISDAFLRGCGLSDWEVESAKLYQLELRNEDITNILYRVHDLRARQAIQISPLFISYSHADGPFVGVMEAHLNERGIRFWRDVHHSTAGRLETQIDRAIRLNPTVLLVLSEHSVKSDWVEHEARLARKMEQETARDVLCPVALDDSWKTCRWPERLREQIMEYNVLNFSNWRDPDYMRRMFTRLIEGLGLFYK